MSGVWLLIASLTINLFLIILFFSKKYVSNDETKIYSFMLILSFIYSSVALGGYIFAKTVGIEFIIAWIQRFHLITTFLLSGGFLHYNAKVLKNDKVNIFTGIFFLFNIIIILCILILPIKVINYDDILDVGGFAYDVAMLGVATNFLLIVISTLVVMITHKNELRKIFPLLALIFSLAFALILRMYYPEIITETYCISFVLLIMYHTIENPDIKLLNEMTLAKTQSERSNRAKSDFLSSMSHEIRTPLNAIVGLSENIASYKESIPKEVFEDTQDIINASQTLLEIVGNILDINKIESEKMEIIENKYPFKETIENMCKVTTTRIGEKPIHFTLTFAEDIPYELIGDKGKVKEIINNLLTNAIKYTEKGEIELSIKCINDYTHLHTNLLITCRDTGRGIKQENIHKLFTKFERLDIEKNTTTEGTGLGLAITKSLVSMMGGKINVQSQFGKGSLFMVQIPQKISQIEYPVKEDVKEKDNLVEEKKYVGKRILVVDDNKLNIKVARKSLQTFSFEIEECYDGQTYLEKVREKDYDLILMDIMMPIMGGVETLRQLKEDPNFNTPVLALTADAIAGAKEKYISEGFKDYLAKPFNREQIKEKLDSIFK